MNGQFGFLIVETNRKMQYLLSLTNINVDDVIAL